MIVFGSAPGISGAIATESGWCRMTGKLFVVVGGQFGSEGKGAVAGRICADMRSGSHRVVNVRVGGPNAGHTVLGRCPSDCGGDGAGHNVGKHPWRLRQVPVAAVTNEVADLVIAAGSEVDLDVLSHEVSSLDSAGYTVTPRLLVDRAATLLTFHHKIQEEDDGLQARLGSTAKGIGAARADRLWRRADTVESELSTLLPDVEVIDSVPYLAQSLRLNDAVVIEGTQGYGLGLHTQHYPFTTSGDCRAIDFLAQAGINPWQRSWVGTEVGLKVVVCLRPYPIRVAGNSGEMKGETCWQSLNLPEERTTVTQKVRRVGEWDTDLAVAALRANGGPAQGMVWVALTMMDSVDPNLSGENRQVQGWRSSSVPKDAQRYMDLIGLTAGHLGYVGTGPDTALVNREMYA